MLTQRMQALILRDLCEGRQPPPALRPCDLDEPWRTCYGEIRHLPLDGRRPTLLSILSHERHHDAFVAFLFAEVAGDRPPSFPSLAEIAATLPPITWLWEGWIPRGTLTLLGSLPGAGKSLVALDLARRLISGLPFPDGTLPPGDPQGRDGSRATGDRRTAAVVYVDAEGLPQLIDQRARQWGMDRSKLFLMLPEPDHPIDFCRRPSRERLVEIVHATHPALVIVDSLSCVYSRSKHGAGEARQVLAFLNDLAAGAGCALLLTHHLRERRPPASPRRPLSAGDFRGAFQVRAVARSAIGLSVVRTGPQPDRNGPRRLEVIKTNLARHPPPLGLALCPQDNGGVTLCYRSGVPTPYGCPTDVDACAAWLLDTLRQHAAPMRPCDLLPLAAEQGYSHSTLYRARRALDDQVANTSHPHHPRNEWTLPLRRQG